MPSEQEMMADLAAADAAGDAELAQHIAGQIKAARVPQQPQHGRFAEAAHKTAALLPVAGGIVGGALGTPGSIPTMALGAGAGAATGKALQHFADSALGYEQPNITETTLDAAKTGATDAATTGAGGMLLSMLAKAARPLAGPLNALGNKLGSRVLSGGTTPLSARKPLTDAAIDAAHEVGAFKPFGTTQGAADTLAAAKGRAGAADGRLLAALEQSGVAGPERDALAGQLEAEGAQKAVRSLGSPEPGMFQGAAAELRTKPADAQGRLSLGAAEDMKRTLQFEAQREYDKIARQYTPTGEAKKALASRMRQAVEDAVSSGASPDDAAAFVAAKQRYGNLAQASNAAEEGAARAARRSPVSLFDMLALTAGYGHGGIAEGPGALLASKLARTYGPSTGTWALKGAAQGLQSMGSAAPAAVGGEVGAALGADLEPPSLTTILEALRRKRALSPAVAQNE